MWSQCYDVATTFNLFGAQRPSRIDADRAQGWRTRLNSSRFARLAMEHS